MEILKGTAISLMIALFCYLSVPSVFASNNLSAGSSYAMGSTYQLNCPNEVGNATLVTAQIANYSSAAGYSAYNWYGSQTTLNNIYAAAAAEGSPNSISFFTGHGNYQPDLLGYNHWCFPDNNGNEAWDYNIISHTQHMDTSFVFLWACQQADVIGGYHLFDYPYYFYGMPFVWLQTNGLSSDGYLNPDYGLRCFTGWNGDAPGLSYHFIKSGEFPTFLEAFYYSALVQGYSVNQALDYAAYQTWGVSYYNCELRTGVTWSDGSTAKMAVYGDGTMHLKPLQPMFAMKTLVNGEFYKPSVTVPFMKIEEWFTNSSAEGDLTGNAVAGYPCPFPDGVVELSDLVTIANAYGATEGGAKWNYQADVVPDRVVGLSDLVTVAVNYGARGSGWYSTDLSRIYVSFNFTDGSTITHWPDSKGFVPIPWNCTDFTVYQQQSWPWPDTTVGAFITFWG